MAALFSSTTMALGYARSRPPLHERIVALAGLPPADRALDIGCGSGLSTKALQNAAKIRIGIEPVASMVVIAPQVAPGAHLVHGSAEALPFRDGSCDLLAAAGSLNYVDLDTFFPEAQRVLTPGGLMLVYDFSQGRSFTNGSALDDWFREFTSRYPAPPGHGRYLDPEILASLKSGFRMAQASSFEIPLPMTPDAYIDYMMTETNISHAVEAGAQEHDIREWCAGGIRAAFGSHPKDVVFRGYYAVLSAQN